MTKYDISDFPFILLIDCHQVDETAVAIIKKESSQVYKKSLRAQQLPEIITELFSNLEQNFSEIKALGVLNQEGSLTGMRVGVSAINTLAWTNDIPVFTFESENIDEAASAIQKGSPFHLVKRLSAN